MPFKTPLGGNEPLPEGKDLSPEDQDLLNRIAEKIVQKQMSVPAILMLESFKPLNWIGSQMMVFLDPFVSAVVGEKSRFLFTLKDYNRLQQMMEKRENTERLLQKIEELDAIQYEKEREKKRKNKAEKKGKRGRFWRKLFSREKPEDSIPPSTKNT